jgi:hypothetical protein
MDREQPEVGAKRDAQRKQPQPWSEHRGLEEAGPREATMPPLASHSDINTAAMLTPTHTAKSGG